MPSMQSYILTYSSHKRKGIVTYLDSQENSFFCIRRAQSVDSLFCLIGLHFLCLLMNCTLVYCITYIFVLGCCCVCCLNVTSFQLLCPTIHAKRCSSERMFVVILKQEVSDLRLHSSIYITLLVHRKFPICEFIFQYTSRYLSTDNI